VYLREKWKESAVFSVLTSTPNLAFLAILALPYLIYLAVYRQAGAFPPL
jgi:hypothetical protein